MHPNLVAFLPVAVIAALIAALIAVSSSTGFAQNVFINEIHYDNTGADLGESVEIVAPAGTDLGAYELLFYNGANGESYGGIVLSGTTPDQGGAGFGAIAFPFEGIQNGAPDGIVLFHIATQSVVQFLSYEGGMTAIGGVADGSTSTEMGVAETASTAVGTSLQLIGIGGDYGDFTWTRGGASSFGMFNAGQTLEGGTIAAALNLTLSQNRLVESAGTTVEARVLILPPPRQAVELSINLSDSSAATAPAEVTTDAAGVAVFPISAVDNTVDDGDRRVRVVVSDATGDQVVCSVLIVVDDDRMPVKGEAVRVASFNLLNGAGDRGGVGYNAVAASLSRIEPDVIAFQEVDSAHGFRSLQSLLVDIAFETDAMHFATVDDQFALDGYNGGDFNNGRQSLAIASRYPIKRVVQIGRDVPDARREITRFPLYAEIDVPWTDDADDLHVICVHYKAGTRDADRFRKAVEAYRTLAFLASEGITAETHNVIVLGDFNENTGNFQPSAFNTGRTTFADGSILPNGFALGDDLSGANAVNLSYDSFPTKLFGDESYRVSSARHADREGIRTLIVAEGVRLDYMVLGDRLHQNGNRFTEVFNSVADVDFDGLPKQGSPVDESVSRSASDHYPVFGDYWLKPVHRITVSLSVASPSLDEGSDEVVLASVVLTPAPGAGQVVTVSLSDVAGDLVMPSTVSVVGPNNSYAFAVAAAQDGRADRSRTVSLIAEADGYATGYGSILVENANASGALIISQMLHSIGADGALALEIVNASTDLVHFAEIPAELRIYPDGSVKAKTVIALDQGSLAPGEVVVLGNAALSDVAGR